MVSEKVSMFLLLNYFSNIKRRMKIESNFNEWMKSAAGAPQRSSLGLIQPILTNVFINGLFLSTYFFASFLRTIKRFTNVEEFL